MALLITLLSLASPWLPASPWLDVFRHSGSLHLVLNLLMLWTIGRAVERRHGRLPACVVFAVSAAGGMLLHHLARPGVTLIGISAGCLGLLAAHLTTVNGWRVLRVRIVFVPVAVRAGVLTAALLLALTAAHLAAHLQPGIAHTAHLGGALAGLAAGQWLRARQQPAMLMARL